MSEIEKIRKYISNTQMDPNERFYMSMLEAFELAHKAQMDDLPIEVCNLAFKYGKAKGYRAAKAERRAAV